MYSTVNQALANKPVIKNPTPHLQDWLKRISIHLGMRPSYFKEVELTDGCQVKKPIDLLKRVVKRNYDNRSISQKNRSPECPWLRK